MPKKTAVSGLTFIFTENGFELDERGDEVSAASSGSGWTDRFRKDRMLALYDFGFADTPKGADAAAAFLQNVSRAFISSLADNPDIEVARDELVVPLDDETAEKLLGAVPFSFGSQFVTREWLEKIFAELNKAFSKDMLGFDGSAAMYLAGKSQNLKAKERVFFHLVEQKDEEYPFAFLATYSTRGESGGVQHVPLQYALTEYAGNRAKLLALLAALNRVCEESEIIADFVESGEMFHPLRLTSDEAYEILKDIPKIEAAGIVCRIPNWWRRKSAGFGVNVRVNAKKESFVGLESIVSADPQLTVDGEPLTREELEKLLAQADGLAFIKGKWVEVDHDKLKALLAEIDELGGDMTLLETLRMTLDEDGKEGEDSPTVVHSEWLGEIMARLRNPAIIEKKDLPDSFSATLRPYQETGYEWLRTMAELGLGACLADDMGLGKTVQILAYLEDLRTSKPGARVLLIVPASLLGNWEKEKQKFAPDMPVHILHGKPAPKLAEDLRDSNAFLTVTTYGMAARMEDLAKQEWDAVILDEAQAIKNPKTKQSQQIRKIRGRSRIALTGTPIENDLVNLWAIFDFLDRGLLGSMKEFKEFSAGLSTKPEGYAALRNMIAPFMLRRMKTDKSIISDLPEKVEIVDYVSFSKKQQTLYKRVVDGILEELQENQGSSAFQRSALVLRSIMKLKQICNHPDQYLGQPVSNWKDSGKFDMLRDICTTIAENRERVLVFTQFREMVPHIDRFLHEIFGTKGFTIDGSVPPKKRSKIVDAFQSERYYPYVVVTVKAGGTGLNLTNANHVIHFDRWWNPAVENQATDRAFRIGQKKDVMVHKLVCKGTIEEKIDQMIESKKKLAEDVIGSGENWITKLDDNELASLMQFSR